MAHSILLQYGVASIQYRRTVSLYCIPYKGKKGGNTQNKRKEIIK